MYDQSQRMPMRACFVRVLWCGLLLSCARWATADNGEAVSEPPAATEGVLVMRTGTIVSGRIRRSGKIYEIQGPNGGKWSVPEDLVKLRCDSISEAYEKLRESAKKQGDANAQITLARWCLTNHLEKEAVQELKDALTLEPDRQDAKRLLRNAEESLKQDTEAAAPAQKADPPSRGDRLNASAPDETVTLGELSRDLALQFSRRIQPLLLNNCTAAGCHGRDAQASFRLYRVTPGKDSNRYAAERNLAEILECIDPKRPQSSPLLTMPRGKHGRRGRPVFAGPRGEEQFAELEKWVVAVARGDAIRERRSESSARGKGPIQQASASSATETEDATTASDGKASRTSKAAGASGTKSGLPAQQPLPEGRGDPFDPAAFNRAIDRRSKR